MSSTSTSAGSPPALSPFPLPLSRSALLREGTPLVPVCVCSARAINRSRCWHLNFWGELPVSAHVWWRYVGAGDAAAMMSHSLPRPGRPPSPREARHPARRLFGVLSADRGGSGCETPGQPDAQVQGPTTTLFTTCVLNPLMCFVYRARATLSETRAHPVGRTGLRVSTSSRPRGRMLIVRSTEFGG